MMMCGPLVKVYAALTLGYILCVVAKKQQDLLKTVGYTIGISLMVVAFAWGLMTSCCPMSKDMHKMMGGHKSMKHSMMKMNCPMMK